MKTKVLTNFSVFIMMTLVLSAFVGVSAAASPDATASLNIDPLQGVMIGEDFEFDVSLNNSGDPGYGPFIDLVFPNNGADGAAGTDTKDGINFVSGGSGVSVTSMVFPDADGGGAGTTGCVDHPFAVDNTGSPVQVCGTAGDTLVVLQLPYSSIAASMPAINVQVTAHVSNLADVDTPLTILARGGYRFGADNLNNPASDPSILTPASTDGSGWPSLQVTPKLIHIEKSFNGPVECPYNLAGPGLDQAVCYGDVNPAYESVSGPNFARQYDIHIHVAAGQTITSLDVTDYFPNNIAYLSVANLGGGTLVDSPTVGAAANSPNNDLIVNFASLTGDTDIVVNFFIPELNADGNPVLAPATGASTISDNIATALGDWTPVDPRDAGGPDNAIANGPCPGSCVSLHTLNIRSLAVQKSVEIATDNGAPGYSPGDILKYTLSFQISDYFTYGDIVLTDVLRDGQHFDNPGGDFPPIFSVSDRNTTLTDQNFIYTPPPGSPAPGDDLLIDESQIDYTGVPADGTDGSTKLTFDISKAMTNAGASDEILQGGEAGTTGAIPAFGTITYYAVIQEDFSDSYPSTDSSVDHGDVLSDSAKVDATLRDETTITNTLGTQQNDSFQKAKIVHGDFVKEIYAINGSTSFTPEVKPGDTITFRLRQSLPSSDSDKLVLKDFLPLPQFNAAEVTTFDNVTDATVPAAGHAKYGPNSTLNTALLSSPVPTIGTDPANNSASFDFGSFDDTADTTSELDILFTVTVSNASYITSVLTNVAFSQEDTTNAGQLFHGGTMPTFTFQAPGVTVTESGGSTDVSEGGTTDTYTIVLTSQPASDVTISFNTGSQIQAIADVTFTNANWNVAKTITVTAVDDGIVEGPHAGTISHTAASGDLGYDGITIADVTANITDNDSYSVIITESGGTTDVTEGGATDTYTIVLGSQPTTDVDVTITPDSQVDTDFPSVTFTNTDWNTPQTITVTAIDDSVAEGTHTGTIAHTAASGDGNYDGISVASVTAHITDNDFAGVTITETAGSTDVTEGGATDTYDIVLTSQPAFDVTITFNTGTQIQSISSISFNDTDWDTAKTITVTAVDDGIVEGPHTGTISHTATSSDANYSGISVTDVTANITDNDSYAVIITESGGSTDVTEGGATDTYTIVLGSQPSADVTVTLTPDSQVTVGPATTATFTNANWNTPQPITVTAVDDSVAEGTHTGTITHTAASGDGNYDGISVSDVVANITDNDFAGAQVTESGGSTDVAEGGATDTYDIVLTSQPTSDVTISFDAGTQLKPIADITFTTSDWNVAQTITVEAIDDNDLEGPHTGTIVHTVTSGDSSYNGVVVSDVIANITDNDALQHQDLAIDPARRFVIYTSPTPGCVTAVLIYQALDSGNPVGAPLQLTACGVTTGDASGIDLVRDGITDFYYISFGGSLSTDGKFIVEIDNFGNIVKPATLVVQATSFGSTPGATAINRRGSKKLYVWIAGGNGVVYRAVINKLPLTLRSMKTTSLILQDQRELAVTQTAAKSFLAVNQTNNVQKAIEVNRKGLPDGIAWRLSPVTDGGHQIGGVSADGQAALSNMGNTPENILFAQPLDATTCHATGGANVVAQNVGQIFAVDISSAMLDGTRYVVYTTADGVFLQRVDATLHKTGPAIPVN